MLQSQGFYNPGVVMRCDFKNDIDCSALPFQTRGEKKMIYLPNVVLFVIFSWKKNVAEFHFRITENSL